MKSFLELVIRADVSPTWLLLGQGPKRLSAIRPARPLNLLLDEEVFADVLEDDFAATKVKQKKALRYEKEVAGRFQKGGSKTNRG